MLNRKHKHWCGLQKVYASNGAPDGVLHIVGRLQTQDICRPCGGRGPIVLLHHEVTKTWIPAFDGDPIRGAGKTRFLKVPDVAGH